MKAWRRIPVLLLIFAFLQSSGKIVEAYSDEQKAKIASFQQEYRNLDQTVYNYQNIYQKAPVFSSNFFTGADSEQYLQSYNHAYNFIRSLFGLASVNQNQEDNQIAITGSYDMAAVPRSDGSNIQHGLTNLPKPAYIDSKTWQKGISATRAGNIANIVPNNFGNYAQQKVKDNILDFIIDNNNYEPKSVGHRSWMLSQALDHYGIGTIYTNPQNLQTSIIQGSQRLALGYQVFYWGGGFNDEYQSPLVEPLTYPASNLFPLEFLNSKNPLKPVYWSIAFNQAQAIDPTHKPQIKLTNLKTHQVTNIAANDIFYESEYGGYNTVFTYLPRGLNLQLDQTYEVEATNLNLKSLKNGQKFDRFTYQVSFFNLTTNSQNSYDLTNAGKVVYVNYLPNYGVRIYQNPGNSPSNIFALHGSSWKITRQYQDSSGKIWTDLGNNQWLANDYLTQEANGRNPIGTVNYIKGFGINLWQGYGRNRVFTGRRLADQSQWKVFKKAVIDDTYWFNLGGDLWVEGSYLKVTP